MADEKRDTTHGPSNNETGTETSSTEQSCVSTDTCQVTSHQTTTIPVHHVIEAQMTMGVDKMDQKTPERNPQAQDEGGTQLATALNVVGSEGPVQIGTGSTVINNPTYDNDNSQHHHHHHHHYHPSPYHLAYHNDYLRWVELNGPGPSCSERSPDPLPQLLEQENYHLKDKTSRVEDTAHRHTPFQSQTIRNTFPHSDHHEDNSSFGTGSLYQGVFSEISHSDVQASGNADYESIENATQAASESGKRRQVCCDELQDSVYIMDSTGQALEPGDGVWFGSGYGRWAIYVGNQEVVHCEGRDNMLVKSELKLNIPFRKCTFISGRCESFPPRERVERAMAMIQKRFTDGDEKDGSDFPQWIFTGLGGNKAWNNGFRMYR